MDRVEAVWLIVNVVALALVYRAATRTWDGLTRLRLLGWGAVLYASLVNFAGLAVDRPLGDFGFWLLAATFTGACLLWSAIAVARYRNNARLKRHHQMTGEPVYPWHMGPMAAFGLWALAPGAVAGGMLVLFGDSINERSAANALQPLDFLVVGLTLSFVPVAVIAPWIALFVQDHKITRQQRQQREDYLAAV